MNNEISYQDKWVLINAHFYKFWMLRTEFNKYNITNNQNNYNQNNYNQNNYNQNNYNQNNYNQIDIFSIIPLNNLRIISILNPP